jgi:hypothetical protein
MKYKILKLGSLLILALITAATFLGITALMTPPLDAASFTVPTQDLRATGPISNDLTVTNLNNTVGLKVNKASTVTSNLVELSHGGTLKFVVPTNGVISTASGGLGTNTVAGMKSVLGIQAGTVTTAGDATVTNTFSPAFSSAPICVMSPSDNGTYTLTTTTVTSTHFIIQSSAAGRVWKWHAIGAP